MSSGSLLVVGSALEARIVLSRLGRTAFEGTVYHLPGTPPAEGEVEAVSSSHLPEATEAAPEKVRLLDVWGNTLVSLGLPPLRVVEPARLPPPSTVQPLAPGLRVSRTQSGGEGVTVSFSDGSDLLCQGVIFGDGADSASHTFWNKPVPAVIDPEATRCWSFYSENLLGIDSWEFRWAAAKSVEILPLPSNRLRVRVRFKTPHGPKLSVTELRELFSEFGSDMTALFENLEEDRITPFEESRLVRSVFHPAPGCVSLGRAAWNSRPLLTFGWLGDYAARQADIVAEQLEAGAFSPESFEAQSRERLKSLEESEAFLRRHLHHDNVLLRPLRNMLLKLLPDSFVAPRLRRRLHLVD